ncbi:MAG: OstA-like protein [bacterium]
MRKLSLRPFIILLAVFIFFPPGVFSFETKKDVPVRIKADRLEYIEDENLIVGQGSVNLEQGDTKLQADYMKFYIDTDNIYAKGNVLLVQTNSTLKGEELNYNIKKNNGIMEKSSSKSEPWLYDNEEIEQVEENQFYAGKPSLFTTCDKPSPHYRFKAKEIILYPKRRLVCKDVSFMIRNVPTIYYPFYTRKLDERNRWHFKLGYNRRKGVILRAKYDYFFNDNSYGNYYIDWWQFVGWGTGFDHKFSLFSGEGKGRVFLYYSKVKTENPSDDYSYTGPETEEWKIDANYEQMLYENTSFETAYNTSQGKESINEKKITVNSKLDLHYRSNVTLGKEVENTSDATKDINSTFDITTVRYPNIVFRAAVFQRNLWDDDLKKFKKTEERLPDISFSLLPTQVGRTKPPVNYSANASYIINFDRGDREEVFDVIRNDLNPDAGNSDIYIVKLAAFPSAGTVYPLATDNTGSVSIPVELISVDYEKKEVKVKNKNGPFKLDPRDKITIKYATKFSTQSAFLYQRLQTNFDIFKSRTVNISFMPAVGYNEDWRDKKTTTDFDDRRVSSFDTQNTLSTRITDYITWQNTHDYKRKWQDLDEDPYKGIERNSFTASLGLNSPFDSRTILYRMTITTSISYDIRRKNESYYDTAVQKIIIKEEKEPVENRKSKFSDLNISLTSRPKDYFDLVSNIRYDIYCDSTDITYPVNVQKLKKGKLKSIESTLHYAPNTYFDFTYRHNLTYFYPLNSFATLDSLVRVPLTRYWEGSCLGSFRNDDIYVPRLKDFKLEKYKIALKRDLHCWEAEFSIRKQVEKIGVPEEVEFWLTLSLKAFPDKKFGVLGKERYLEIRDQI